MTTSSIFAKFRGATPRGADNWIQPGNHLFLVRRCEMGPSKNTSVAPHEKCVVEFKIIKSDTMAVNEQTSFVDTNKNPQGGYLGNVNALVAGILGMTIDQMNLDPDFEAIFDNVFGTAQIFTGLLVRCTAQANAAKTYTNKLWEPVPASEYPEYGLIAPEGAFVPGQ